MKKAIILALVILGWVTLTIRLYLRIVDYDFHPIESIIQFFSYFTILTNLLVTVYCTGLLLKKDKESNSIFGKPETILALTVYILIVGIVYHIVLRSLWNPTGLTMVLSEIHHSVTPIGMLILWIISDNKNRVILKSLIKWLFYPFIYITYVLIRGSFSNFYPYPFLDVQALSLQGVLINSLILIVVMFSFLILFYFLGKKLSKS